MRWLRRAPLAMIGAMAAVAMLTLLTAGTTAAHEGYEPARGAGFRAGVVVQRGRRQRR